MNPIQRAWLKVLGPAAYFVNERLASRAGNFAHNFFLERIFTATFFWDKS
jgi:hypothetical protein